MRGPAPPPGPPGTGPGPQVPPAPCPAPGRGQRWAPGGCGAAPHPAGCARLGTQGCSAPRPTGLGLPPGKCRRRGVIQLAGLAFSKRFWQSGGALRTEGRARCSPCGARGRNSRRQLRGQGSAAALSRGRQGAGRSGSGLPARRWSSQSKATAPLPSPSCRDGGLKVCLGVFTLHDVVQLSGYTSDRGSVP